MGFFVTIWVIELEKSDQIKVFKLTDVNADLHISRQLPENSLRTYDVTFVTSYLIGLS